jgi:uncharacterized membrane-anchored protein
MRNTLFLAVLTASLAATTGIAQAKKAAPVPPKAPAKEAHRETTGGVVGGLVGGTKDDAPAADKDDDAAAADHEPSEEEIKAYIEKEHADVESQLHFESGTITLVGGKVKLALPDGYRYLGPADTNKVIQKWGNLPDDKTQGMILPKGMGLWEQESVAIILEYKDEGHVSDDDAAKIDYTDLMKSMRASQAEENKERAKQGLDTLELVGWAEPPRYDKATRKLYWATELASSTAPEHGLNYSVRVLGRESVLDLDAIGSMAALAATKEEMQKVITFAEFTSGNQYTDFKKGKDRTAEYGIAGLVAGGVALKVLGGGKGLIALLAAGWKFFLMGAVAVAAFFQKMWAKLTGKNTLPQATIATTVEKGPGEP